MENKVILKLVLSVLGSAFLLGTIFWAGAAYNRLSSIEGHMMSIDAKISDLGALNERVNMQRNEIDLLRQEMREMEHRENH